MLALYKLEYYYYYYNQEAEAIQLLATKNAVRVHKYSCTIVIPLTMAAFKLTYPGQYDFLVIITIIITSISILVPLWIKVQGLKINFKNQQKILELALLDSGTVVAVETISKFQRDFKMSVIFVVSESTRLSCSKTALK